MPPAGCVLVAQDWVRMGGERVPVSEVTDKPVTPAMGPVAALLPGSSVAQLGPTPFGKDLIGGRGARL